VFVSVATVERAVIALIAMMQDDRAR